VNSDSAGRNLVLKNVTSRAENTEESTWPLVATIVGSSLLALLCLSGVLWFAFKYRRKSRLVRKTFLIDFSQ